MWNSMNLLQLLLLPFLSSLLVAESDQIINDLLQWAREEGGIVDNIKVGNSKINGAGRALLAINQSREGSVLVSVPKEMLITDIVARSDPMMKKHALSFSKKELQLDSCMTVTLFLMMEKLNISGTQSKYIKYFRSLPPIDHTFNLPQLEWNSTVEGRKALDILHSSPSMSTRLNAERLLQEKAMERLMLTVFPSLMKDSNHSIDTIIKTFIWAKSVILTRSWTKPHSSIDGECTMVPILDLLNHDEGGGGLVAVAFDDQPNNIHSFGVLATTNYSSGDEVVDSYDPPGTAQKRKCVQDMFIGFGFLPYSTKNSRPWCFDMKLTVKTNTFRLPSTNMKQLQLLQKLNAKPGELFSVQLKEGADQLPLSLLALMRVCIADETDIMIALNRGNASNPLTFRNERKVLSSIYTVMLNNLEKIPSSNEVDLEEIQKGSTDEKVTNALQIRIHERNILIETMSLVKELWFEVMFDDEL